MTRDDWLSSRKPIDRRALLGLTTGLLAAVCGRGASASGDTTLKSRAARRGLSFGAAVHIGDLADAAYCDAVARECDIIVPEWEMKWRAIQPVRDRFDFGRADQLIAFARERRLAVRGHTLAWHKSIPDWARPELEAGAGQTFLKFVETNARHFSDRLAEWDVVNEAVDASLPRGLRKSPLLAAFGESYITEAFRVARQADRGANLYYNDFGFEYADRWSEGRRRAVLALLTRLKQAAVPVDGFGTQCHLKIGRRFDAKRYRRFLRDIADLELKIAITELDVRDDASLANDALRDRKIADHVREFLDAALDEKAVVRVVTWGLSDRYSSLNRNADWSTHPMRQARGLPFDNNMEPKLLWEAIGGAFDNAPDRNSGFSHND